jgi:phosphatidate cytidylyltransferase
MTRVLSALVLLPVVIGTIWFLPPFATVVLALVAAVLAFFEYRAIASALGAPINAGIGGTAVFLTCLVMAADSTPRDVIWTLGEMPGHPAVIDNPAVFVLMAAFIVVGALAVGTIRPGANPLATVSATLFAPIYLGLPLGALAAVRGVYVYGPASGISDGSAVLLLLLAVIVVSDSAQYYTGRAVGRRPLAPTISPKKTIEGAIGGVVFGTLAFTVGGRYVFASPLWILALSGAAISLLGIVGDLFESLLKRSAGVKDSSNLIPGHGGVLDRIDSWLFAAPVYYVFVRFIA